jgi:hypothetical protein
MRRWVNMIAVLAIAALFANSQCYALCFAARCQTVSTQKASGCHEKSRSQSDGAKDCQHGQADLTSTEASPDLAKLPAVSLTVVTLLPPAAFTPEAGRFPQTRATLQQRGSPPGTQLFLSLSVLRI